MEIPLSRGMVAFVDAEDFDCVMGMGRWCADPGGKTFYARKNIYVPGQPLRPLMMHAFITGVKYVDHRNLNGLDNRRTNLRPATPGQNAANKGIYRNNKSGFKGVHRRNDKNYTKPWRAVIKRDGRAIRLGMFATPEEAAHAYDAAAMQIFGEFARFNFPQERQ